MVYLCVGKVDMKETIDLRIVNNIYTGPPQQYPYRTVCYRE